MRQRMGESVARIEQKNRFSDTSENKTKCAQNISLMLDWPDFFACELFRMK